MNVAEYPTGARSIDLILSLPAEMLEEHFVTNTCYSYPGNDLWTSIPVPLAKEIFSVRRTGMATQEPSIIEGFPRVQHPNMLPAGERAVYRRGHLPRDALDAPLLLGLSHARVDRRKAQGSPSCATTICVVLPVLSLLRSAPTPSCCVLYLVMRFWKRQTLGGHISTGCSSPHDMF